MHEPVVADVDADMVDGILRRAEEDQVAITQLLFAADRISRLELVSRGAGNIEAAQVLDRTDKAAAVHAVNHVFPAPAIGDSDKAFGGPGGDGPHIHVIL